MKPEEAGELLLGEPEWVDCRHCQGTGEGECEYTKAVVQGYMEDLRSLKSEELMVRVACSICKGKGASLSHNYERACRRVNRPLPARPLAYQLNVSVILMLSTIPRITRVTFMDGSMYVTNTLSPPYRGGRA